MWFIADLFERTTSRMARSLAKFADVYTAPPAAAEKAAPEAVDLAVETPAGTAIDVVKGDRAAAQATVAEVKPAVTAEVDAAASAMPRGVRGDVVMKWLAKLGDAERRTVPDLLESLRKDKKVRVAELQMICAEALSEEPQVRKKPEHLAKLRAHFLPAERVSTGTSVPIHAPAS
ncbi:MAG: hypothetical protein AAGJ94_03510 [Pseudomonadota bacterium]